MNRQLSTAPETIGGRQGRLRGTIPLWESVAWGLLLVLVVFALWWYVTAGEREQRIISGAKLPSPRQTFRKFPSLWFDHALTRNTYASLRRVALGFLLATSVGVPLGVACGCFPRIRALFTPLLVFGRNIPMAAVIPLTILLFGIEERQKVMFIFIASAAFVISDSAQAVSDVPQKYIDTAYTLGASRWQVIRKVLFPLALPSILNSLRLLFGLAFGYIMLAEVISVADDAHGLGGIINTLERRSHYEQIYLILLVIPIVAFLIDRLLFWCQRELLPYQYPGSKGLLARGWKEAAAASAAARRALLGGGETPAVGRASSPSQEAAADASKEDAGQSPAGDSPPAGGDAAGGTKPLSGENGEGDDLQEPPS